MRSPGWGRSTRRRCLESTIQGEDGRKDSPRPSLVLPDPIQSGLLARFRSLAVFVPLFQSAVLSFFCSFFFFSFPRLFPWGPSREVVPALRPAVARVMELHTLSFRLSVSTYNNTNATINPKQRPAANTAHEGESAECGLARGYYQRRKAIATTIDSISTTTSNRAFDLVVSQSRFQPQPGSLTPQQPGLLFASESQLPIPVVHHGDSRSKPSVLSAWRRHPDDPTNKRPKPRGELDQGRLASSPEMAFQMPPHKN